MSNLFRRDNQGTRWSGVEFVLCLRNDGYPASLERCKLYRVVRDPEGEALGRIRIIDESGEDYLYPRDYFAPVELPQSLAESLAESLAGSLTQRLTKAPADPGR